MAKQLSDILERAAQVRDEQTQEANTAQRVGGVMADLAQFVGQSLMASDVQAQATRTGVQLKLFFHDDNGREYTRTLVLPNVNISAGLAGVLTTEQYDAMKQFGAVKDLGTFATKQLAWNACAVPGIAGDSRFFILKFMVGSAAFYMVQSVGETKTMQYFYEGEYRFTRYIQFSNSNHDVVTEVQPFQKEGVRNLYYNSTNRVLMMRNMWGEQIGDSWTVPMATTGQHGFMDKADKSKLDSYAGTFATNPVATTSLPGLMGKDDKTHLNNTLFRGVYWFDGEEDNITAVTPEQVSTTTTGGKILFVKKVNDIGGTIVSRFLYKVNLKYYTAAPSSVGKVPGRLDGIYISNLGGGIFVVDTNNELQCISQGIADSIDALSQRVAALEAASAGTTAEG